MNSILEINNLTRARIDKKFLKEVAEKACKSLPRALVLSLSKHCRGEISLVFVGEARMRRLNKKYRGKNQVTDILAFDYGEIFICLPQAKRQAKQLGHSLKKELATLLIHGILHLAGHADERVKDREKMISLQDKIVSRTINQ